MIRSLARVTGTTLSFRLIAIAGPALAQVSNPDVVVSESLSTLPQNASVTIVDLGAAAKAGLVTQAPEILDNGAATVTFTGKSGVYSGNTSGVAAAPYTATGPEKTNYLAAEPGGAVTMTFKSQQEYFGMLWGSIDSGNTLSCYNGNTLVETLTGAQINANANGNQLAAGSDIVNVDFNNGLSYNKVVATTPTPAFEFNTVAFAATPIAITAAAIAAAGNQGQSQVIQANPAPLPALGATPLGFAMLIGAAGWMRLSRRTV